jgi:hypothetical protein
VRLLSLPQLADFPFGIVFTMGQDLIFAVIGDSNVRRFVTSLTKKACPDVATAQISSCGKLSMLAEALRQVLKVHGCN